MDLPPEMLPSAGLDPLAEVADILGLQYTATRLPEAAGSDPKGASLLGRMVTGRLDGVTIRVHAPGGKRALVLFYGVLFPRVGLGFRLRRRSWRHRLNELFGTEDIDIGSQAFEEEVHIGGRRTVELANYLTEERQIAVRDLIAMVPNVRILDGSIDGTDRQRLFRPLTVPGIVETIDAFVRAADSLSK